MLIGNWIFRGIADRKLDFQGDRIREGFTDRGLDFQGDRVREWCNESVTGKKLSGSPRSRQKGEALLLHESEVKLETNETRRRG